MTVDHQESRANGRKATPRAAETAATHVEIPPAAYDQARVEQHERIVPVDAQLTFEKTFRDAGLLLGGIALGLAVVVQILGDDMALSRPAALFLTVTFGVGAALALGAAAFMPCYLVVRREEREREKALGDKVEQAAEDIQNAEDLTELVKANTKILATYTCLARTQAAIAFRNSQIAMGIGLVALFVGAAATIAGGGTITKVATASLTAVAGTLAAYLTRTFSQSHQAAIKQLNFAFQQPVVNSYLLASERLAKQMSTRAQKDKALEGLVDKLVTFILRITPEKS